jgi:hypothetical protein
MASVPPPGGNGTIRRTKRFGQICEGEVCENAWPTKAGASAAAAVILTARRRVIIR